MSRRVFFGPRIPALAFVQDMRPRELVIGLTLLVPTLVIGVWPRVAMDLYEASTEHWHRSGQPHGGGCPCLLPRLITMSNSNCCAARPPPL